MSSKEWLEYLDRDDDSDFIWNALPLTTAHFPYRSVGDEFIGGGIGIKTVPVKDLCYRCGRGPIFIGVGETFCGNCGPRGGLKEG